MNREEWMINKNIDYFDSLPDEQVLLEWTKINNMWGESPQSSRPVMHAIFDYFLNYRLPFIEVRNE